MLTVITGGSGSGKSAYAEDYISEIASQYDICNKYYIATMKVYDSEGQKMIERHKNLRQGKNFITVEQPNDIGTILEALEKIQNVYLTKQNTNNKNIALLECMSNLVANEMFTLDENGDSNINPPQNVCNKIISEVKIINDYLDDLVIVTNNVFEDGILYDDTTMEYIKALGVINQQLAMIADHVIEVVVGLPITIR